MISRISIRRLAALSALTMACVTPGNASTPSSQGADVPSKAGSKIHLEWSGTMPPGANSSSDCKSAPLNDQHEITLRVPRGLYRARVVRATFSIIASAATDGIITLVAPDGSSTSNDSGFLGDTEQVTVLNPKPGTYTVLACAFAGGAQSYTGTLDLETSAIGACPPDTVAGIDLQTATIADLQAAMASGKLSSKTLVAAYLARIARYDHKLDSIRALNPHALTQAASLDAERQRQGPRGPLHGIPVLLKDNIGTTDMPTTAGSIALEGSIPLREAFLTERLRAAGAIILGKANLSEFANWVDPDMPNGYSSLGGQVKNAYTFGDPSGSSSGSGVAASMAFAAATIGTETSGSILSPSVTNSDVGIKTTVGLVSRAGVIPLAGTFDTPGPITKNVTDAAIVLGAISGEDPRDPKTADSHGKLPPRSDYRDFLRADGLQGMRIGVSDADRNALGTDEQKLFDAVLAKLQSRGATVVHDDKFAKARNAGLPELGAIPNEFHYYLNKYLAEETPETLRVRTLNDIMNYNAQHTDKVKYGQRWITISNATSGNPNDPAALAARTAAIQGSQEAIDKTMSDGRLDAILAPGAINANVGAAALYPSIAVPAGYTLGGTQPFGITFLGQAFSESKLIQIAYAFEKATRLRVRPTKLNLGLCPPRATRSH